jgi:hypothetical protein
MNDASRQVFSFIAHQRGRWLSLIARLGILGERTKPWEVWPEGSPCGTFDAFFPLCCGRSYEQIRALIADYLGDVDLTRKLDAAKDRADAKVRKQGVRTDLSEHHDNIMKSRQGTDQHYLRRRLARDHPKVLAAYERGKYPSVRAAAIAAGHPPATHPNLRQRARSVSHHCALSISTWCGSHRPLDDNAFEESPRSPRSNSGLRFPITICYESVSIESGQTPYQPALPRKVVSAISGMWPFRQLNGTPIRRTLSGAGSNGG